MQRDTAAPTNTTAPLVLPPTIRSFTVHRDEREQAHPSKVAQAPEVLETAVSPQNHKSKKRTALSSKDIIQNIATGGHVPLVKYHKPRSVLEPLPAGVSKKRAQHVQTGNISSSSAPRTTEKSKHKSVRVEEHIDRPSPTVTVLKHKRSSTEKNHDWSPSKSKAAKNDHPLAEAFKEATTTYRTHLSATLPSTLERAYDDLQSLLANTLRISNAHLTTYTDRTAVARAPPRDSETDQPLTTSFPAFEANLATHWADYARALVAYNTISAEITNLVHSTSTATSPLPTRHVSSTIASPTYASTVAALERDLERDRVTTITRAEAELEELTVKVEQSEEAYEQRMRDQRRQTAALMKLNEDSGDELEGGAGDNQSQNQGHDQDRGGDEEEDDDDDEAEDDEIVVAMRQGHAQDGGEDEIEDEDDIENEGQESEWGGVGKGKGRALMRKSFGGAATARVRTRPVGRRSLF